MEFQHLFANGRGLPCTTVSSESFTILSGGVRVSGSREARGQDKVQACSEVGSQTEGYKITLTSPYEAYSKLYVQGHMA